MSSEYELETICELISVKDEIKDLEEVRERYLTLNPCRNYQAIDGDLEVISNRIMDLSSDLSSLVESLNRGVVE